MLGRTRSRRNDRATASTSSGSCRSATSRVGTLSTPDRLVPGDGDIPIRRILGTVLAAGYPGSFDLELIGPHIEAEGYDSAVPRAVRALDDILEALNA